MSGRTRSNRAPGSSLEVSLLACALICSPIVILLRYNGLRSLPLEVALIAAVASLATLVARATSKRTLVRAFGLAALVTLFIDVSFQFDVPVPGIGKSKLLAVFFVGSAVLIWRVGTAVLRIAAVVGATVLALSLLTPPDLVIVETGKPQRPTVGAPLFVHLVLDEYLGIDGLHSQSGDSRAAAEVRQWLERARFRVFGGAYSQDMWTEKSLGRLFNPTKGLAESVQPGIGWFQYRFTSNDYFDRLVADGYALHVLQTSHVDLCPASLAADCRTYDIRKFKSSEFSRLRMFEKLNIIAYRLATQSDIWKTLRGVIETGWGPAPERVVDVSALVAMDALHDLEARLRTATAGEAYFAHVLAPHHPYSYDRDCRIRPVGDWLDRDNKAVAPELVNTAEGRRTRYQLFVAQMRCFNRVIDDVLEAIPRDLADNAVVIVHGDHGSRITERDPAQPRATKSDFIDSYSTMLAVRSPAIPAGYQSEQISLPCVFRALLNDRFRSLPQIESCGASEPVFAKRVPSVGVMPRMDAAR
jgi:hypothetical protein